MKNFKSPKYRPETTFRQKQHQTRHYSDKQLGGGRLHPIALAPVGFKEALAHLMIVSHRDPGFPLGAVCGECCLKGIETRGVYETFGASLDSNEIGFVAPFLAEVHQLRVPACLPGHCCGKPQLNGTVS